MRLAKGPEPQSWVKALKQSLMRRKLSGNSESGYISLPGAGEGPASYKSQSVRPASSSPGRFTHRRLGEKNSPVGVRC